MSFFITVGNYDYGFYWYLYLDGTIELECKATGVVFASVHPGPQADGSEYPWASEIAPGIGAPYHQHLFSARLDMMVDGVGNAVDEVEAARVPIGPDNPYGNAFTRRVTRLHRESEAAPDSPTAPSGASGTCPTRRSGTRWGSPWPTRCTRRDSRPCSPTRRRRSPGAPRSPPSTSG